MALYPNLDRLNSLLKTAALGLPDHRQRVDASGHNLKFLRKVIPSNPAAPEELKNLLALKDKELMAVGK